MCALLLGSCSGGSKKTTYRIGVDPSWYPLEVGGRDKNILAFSIELLQEIAKKEKLQLVLVRMNWDNLLWGLREHKYQAALSTLTPYVFYQKKYTFSTPYLLTGLTLVLPEKTKEVPLDELQGREIAIVTGSDAATFLQVYSGVIIRSYENVPSALNALAEGHVDAALIDHLIGQSYVNDLYAGKLKVASAPLTDQGLRLLTLFNENLKLIDRFDKGLAAIKENGEYERLMRKWGLLGNSGKSDEEFSRNIEAFLQTVF